MSFRLALHDARLDVAAGCSGLGCNENSSIVDGAAIPARITTERARRYRSRPLLENDVRPEGPNLTKGVPMGRGFNAALQDARLAVAVSGGSPCPNPSPPPTPPWGGCTDEWMCGAN